MAGTPLIIRSAQASDLEKILDLLEPQEFVRPYTREQLRGLFSYPWLSAGRGVALLLMDGETVGGVGATIYSPVRVVDGNERVTINIGTLFVRPRYRARRSPAGVVRYSEELVRAVLTPGVLVVTFSARGPNDAVPRILAGLGFEEVCSADLFYRFGSHARTLLRPDGTLVTAVEEIRQHLTPSQLAILEDHEPLGCRFLVIRSAGRTCFLVTKRRRYRGEWLWQRARVRRIRERHFPVTDVLHMSDPALAIRSWGRLIAALCWRDRTVGVTCTQTFLGKDAPRGTAFPQRVFAYGLTGSVGAIDKLYSEQALLP